MSSAARRQAVVPTSGERGTSPPRWLGAVTTVLVLLGIGVAAYLTVEHFSGSSHLAGCSAHGVVNCARVTTSAESHIAGVPVALLGLLYFVGALPFVLPVAWRSRSRFVRTFRQAGAISGVVFVLWLVFAEFVKIHNICEYCSAVHVITLILFVVITYGTIATSAPRAELWDEDDVDEPASAEHRGAASV